MRNNYLIICMACLLSIPAGLSAQKKANSWLKSGAVLTYQVNARSKQYQFIVKNLKLESNISFDWEMTQPNEMTGSIIIGKDALDTATWQKNNFQAGTETLTDRTTVWVSKKVYNAVKKKKTIVINTGTSTSPLQYKEKQDYSFTLNGETKTVKVLYAETNRAEKFWILDDPAYPLILKMDLSWSVKLLGVTF